MSGSFRLPSSWQILIGDSKASIPLDSHLKTLNSRVLKLQADLEELRRRIVKLEQSRL